MPINGTIDWQGRSGKAYRYWFFDLGAPLKDEPGNYMFVRQLPNGNFLPVYIGQCDDLNSRCPMHERLAEAKAAGATSGMGHTTPAGDTARLAEERDLIEQWNPPLNVQHRRVS